MTNVLNLPQISGSGTTLAITKNADWVDGIFFVLPGSPTASFETTCGITSGSATVTLASTSALAIGMPIVGPGIPIPAYIGTIASGSVSMVDNNGNAVHATATNASVSLTFEPVPLDITGIEFIANVRAEEGSPDVYLIVQTGDGTFNNGGTTGVLAFNVPQAMLQTVPAGSYVLDIIAIADGHTINMFPQGPAAVTVTDGVSVQ